jgi:hypothetical protein
MRGAARIVKIMVAFRSKVGIESWKFGIQRGELEMNVGKVILGMGAAVGLMSSTVAMAATPGAASALSVSHNAPVAGVRNAASLKHKSKQSEGTTAGTYVVGGLAAAAVIAGIVVVASDNGNKSAASPG